MNFLKEASISLSSFHQAHIFIKKNKLRMYVLLPGLISFLLFLGTAIVGWRLSNNITETILNWMNLYFTYSSLSWIQTVLNFLFLILFRLLFFFAYLYSFKYIVLIIMSPVLAYLSEKTETILSGKTYQFEWKVFLKQISRGVSIAVLNASMELILLLCLYFFAAVPIIGLISPFLIFFVQSYFYGYAMLDYYFERQNLGISESIGKSLQHKLLSLTNGAIFYGLLIIPVLGVLVAPTYSVVAAGIALHKIKQNELER